MIYPKFVCDQRYLFPIDPLPGFQGKNQRVRDPQIKKSALHNNEGAPSRKEGFDQGLPINRKKNQQSCISCL